MRFFFNRRRSVDAFYLKNEFCYPTNSTATFKKIVHILVEPLYHNVSLHFFAQNPDITIHSSFLDHRDSHSTDKINSIDAQKHSEHILLIQPTYFYSIALQQTFVWDLIRSHDHGSILSMLSKGIQKDTQRELRW